MWEWIWIPCMQTFPHCVCKYPGDTDARYPKTTTRVTLPASQTSKSAFSFPALGGLGWKILAERILTSGTR